MTSVLFILCATTLAVVLMVIALLPWWRPHLQNEQTFESASYASHFGKLQSRFMTNAILLFKARVAELNQDQQQALISKQAFEQQKVELERQLLQINQDSQLTDKIFLPVSKPLVLLSTLMLSILAVFGIAVFVSTKPHQTVENFWHAQEKYANVVDVWLTDETQTQLHVLDEQAGVAVLLTMQANVHAHATQANRWTRLADMYLFLGAKEQAHHALARAYRLAPDDPFTAFRYAQIQFLMHDGQLSDSSRQALLSVLAQQPNHLQAMMLLAVGEAKAGDVVMAQHWIEQLRDYVAQAGSDSYESLENKAATLASLERLSKMLEAKQGHAQAEPIQTR